MSNTNTPTIFYRTLNVEGLEIFYREAGPRDAPTVLLLHGFPSSSHMFRNLIPLLADKYHVVAPDFPGYGESSAPSVNDFEYSFERLASVTEKFTRNAQSFFVCAIPLGHRCIGWLPVSCHAFRTSDRYDHPKRRRPC
jgi:pimeloyl-ACP methyl ester carboxylesterase